LDPTVRRARLADGRTVTLADTVGFVRHLPHQLIEAFRSTLEEVADADVILHIVDGSHPDPESQLSAVREVLADVDAAAIPELVVVNKIDTADPVTLARLRLREPRAVFVSARTGEGLDELSQALVDNVPHQDLEVEVVLPYSEGGLVARAHREGEVLAETHEAAGTRLRVRVSPALGAELEPYAAAVV